MFLCCEGALADSSKGGKPPHAYSFMSVTTERFGAADSVGLAKIMDGMTEDLYKKTGIRTIIVNSGVGNYEESIYRNKPDFAFMGMDHLIGLKRLGMEYEPLVLASLLGSPGMKICVYTMKDYKDLKGLRGATVNLYGAGSYNLAHMAVRKLLNEHGIDMPIEEFFGDIYKVPFEGSNFQALILGKVQAVIEGDWNYEFYGTKIPQSKTIKELACTDEYPAVGIFMRKGIDPGDVEKIEGFLKKIDKNPSLKELRTFVLALKIKFVEPDAELMRRTEMLYKESKKRGWDAEAKRLTAKMNKLQFGKALKKEKKTYGECKTECRRDKSKEACMDRCMGE